MKPVYRSIYGVVFSLFYMTGTALADVTPGTHEFIFDLTVPKNTCDIVIKSSSGTNNIVDFGNVPLAKFKTDASAGKIMQPFDIIVNNCKTNVYDNNYIKLTGNYTENDGFLDDAGKTFAVRISTKNNAQQASADFITATNNVLWPAIKQANVQKTFYAYVMCKNGVIDCSADGNVGRFKATLTLSYYAD